MSCATVGSGTAVSTPPLPWTRRSPRPGATSPTSRATISERRSAPKHMSATEGLLPGVGALLQHGLDGLPPGHPRQPRLAAWPRQHVDRVSTDLVPPHRPLAQAAQRGQPYANAAGLQPPRRQVILVR